METLKYINQIKNSRLLFSNVPVLDQQAFLGFQSVSNGTSHNFTNGFIPKEKESKISDLPRKILVQKPPPIFLYTDDNSCLFAKFSSFLQPILPSDTYTIANLSLNCLLKHPWIDETPVCLIILNVIPFDETIFMNGRIIFAYQPDDESLENLFKWKEFFANSIFKSNVAFLEQTADFLIENTGLLKNTLANFGIKLVEKRIAVEFSKGYLIAAQDRLLWNMQGLRYGEYIGEKPILFLQPSVVLENNPLVFPKADENLLPIEVCRRNKIASSNIHFNVDEYFGTLNTQYLGKILLYAPVCESTMEVSKSLTSIVTETNGIVVVAGQQTKGRGRSQNQWISVPGMAMFTFNFHIHMNTQLGKSIGYVQHIAATAIVDAVNFLVGEKTDVKIKWPNDLYYKRESKIGGILVQSSMKNDVFHCLIGVGLNVDNSKPTICINDFLSKNCEKLTIESVVAEFMNKFEEYVKMFEEKGRYEFLQKYYDHWLHSLEEVTVDIDGESEVSIIQGLNEHGYLEVRSKKNGTLSQVSDNGNSFDMMKGLIRTKFY